jgi:DNA replication protein DnaC
VLRNAPSELGEERTAWFDLSKRWDAWYSDVLHRNQKRIHQQQRLANFKDAVGERFALSTLENFNVHDDAKYAKRQKAVLNSLRDYSARMPEMVESCIGIWFYGAAGGGKDHLASAMAVEGIEKHDMRVAFTSSTGLAMRLRSTMRKDAGESEEDVVEQLSEADILLISDLAPASGSVTDYQVGVLYDILDTRYRHMRPNWATVNVVDRDEANIRLGAALVDRLLHEALVVHCNWPSYRQGGKPCTLAAKPKFTGRELYNGHTGKMVREVEPLT